ncbi:hypothetical protein CCACVL1_24975 [Corchorus capsularis]|uniref:Uncharacterized protein n=1 Tax=Corchorus capsularis TaxID=210143 RepID=A0A1R3GMJ6_COCAP|nr:hypothetical protein CCACVL1_24975 [Corchorus capsularis]
MELQVEKASLELDILKGNLKMKMIKVTLRCTASKEHCGSGY